MTGHVIDHVIIWFYNIIILFLLDASSNEHIVIGDHNLVRKNILNL